MRLIMVNAPEGKGEEVAGAAFWSRLTKYRAVRLKVTTAAKKSREKTWLILKCPRPGQSYVKKVPSEV